MITFVHVFKLCSQDSSAVLTIMEDVICKLKAIMPSLKAIFYRQTIKAHMKVHLNEGNDIENARQMVDAMRSSGGVPGLNVTLCELETPSSPTHVKFDGVSTVSNVEYSSDAITTWKAYWIGPGQAIKLTNLRSTLVLQSQVYLLMRVKSYQIIHLYQVHIDQT